MTEFKVTRELQNIKTEALNVFENAKTVTIKDQESYEFQGNRLRIIKTQWSEIETKRKELSKPFQMAIKQLNDFFNEPLDVLKKAETCIKQALIKYVDQKEKERIEEEKRLLIEAEKQAAKLEKKAEKQEAKGQKEKAEEIRAEAMSIPVPVVPKKVEKVKGISFKENWKFRIVNETKIPRKYLIPNEKELGQIARSTHGKVNIPGVEFYSEKLVAGVGVY